MTQDVPIGMMGQWKDGSVPTLEMVPHPDVLQEILLEVDHMSKVSWNPYWYYRMDVNDVFCYGY